MRQVQEMSIKHLKLPAFTLAEILITLGIIGIITNNGGFVALDIWQSANITNYTGVQKGLLDGNAHLVTAVYVNGERLPNTLGKDVYMFVLTSNGLVPAGIDNNSQNCEKFINYNWDCAAKVLKK